MFGNQAVYTGKDFKLIKKYEQVSFPLTVGDTLIMYMTTCHKSRENKNETIIINIDLLLIYFIIFNN